MKRIALCVAALAVIGGWSAFTHNVVPTGIAMAQETKSSGPMLAHNVFFTLKEDSPTNRQKLVTACKKYLTGHPGTVFFACGPVSDLDRPVNDLDFDIGLHVIFKDRASHDQYQTAERHLKFIEENKDGWEKVRVFDSDVESAN